MEYNVIYSSSNSYMKCTAVSICSLLENNRDLNRLKVWLMSSDISAINRTKINRIAAEYNREIKIIDASKMLESYAKEMELELFRGTYDVYATLIMDTILADINKVLYIDSDTLVVDSIAGLWEMEMGEKVIAVVPEIGLYSRISSSEDYNILYRSKHYFNTGIIFYDLDNWRNKIIGQKIEECIRDNKGNFKIVDQSIINLAINNEIYPLDLKYNLYSAVHGVKYRTIKKNFSRGLIFSEKEFDSAQGNPVIIHFVGMPFERPWYRKGYSPYKEVYLQYLEKTPWGSEPLEEFQYSANFLLAIYDRFSVFLKKYSYYNFYHWYRYVLGQYIKKLTSIKR